MSDTQLMHSGIAAVTNWNENEKPSAAGNGCSQFRRRRSFTDRLLVVKDLYSCTTKARADITNPSQRCSLFWLKPLAVGEASLLAQQYATPYSFWSRSWLLCDIKCPKLLHGPLTINFWRPIWRLGKWQSQNCSSPGGSLRMLGTWKHCSKT